jgi:hypothetical protein
MSQRCGIIQMINKLVVVLLVLTTCQIAYSETSSFSTDLTNSYYYTDHHEIVINRKAEEVWPHLVNLGSWMYIFAMEHYSGIEGQEGEVLRLYKNQDYFFEITKLVENELLVGINLPITTPSGELSAGLAMMTLTGTDGSTVVSVLMSRKYSWLDDGLNNDRTKRETPEFAVNRKNTFGKFLARLKSLSEGAHEAH